MADLSFHSVPLIQAALEELKTHALRGVTPEAFEQRIMEYVGGEADISDRDGNSMGVFKWGHDHDFGRFKVSGRLGTRHVWMLARFLDHFGVRPEWIRGRRILDVGCWTGGVSLVLNKLGGRVVAIDAAKVRIEPLAYMVEAFELRELACDELSLYDLQGAEFTGAFDIAFCLGVVYHLSEPIVGLRRLYHALKPGGLLCLESMGLGSDEQTCQYHGPSRPGHTWFVPTSRTLSQWLEDTGFETIRVGNGVVPFAVTNETDPMGANRRFAVARRRADHRLADLGLPPHTV